ncbi:unnamed protein product [Microthlaspi erraticum]|uniref:Uncharacterized protein n=1 Tax=Microthlaspi erraticum TaxID=1685480 RepID=A0A6D2J5W7_9BRAS|nr:unnamed protein product [Microthlaspi erraticum]
MAASNMADKTKSRHRRANRLENSSLSLTNILCRKKRKGTSQTSMAKETPSRSRIDHFVKEVSIHSFKCSQTSPEAIKYQIYTTQLFFTPILARLIKKKFNLWIVISLIFAIATGDLGLTSSFGREPGGEEMIFARGSRADEDQHHYSLVGSALVADGIAVKT